MPLIVGLLTDFRFALRSLARARGLAVTVIVTLALGIGANAAIFSVVRGVLLAPARQRRRGAADLHPTKRTRAGSEITNFSVPEINDLKARVRSIAQFGDFSTIDFTLVGLGEPRVVRAGVVSGSFFSVMGLQPVRGRLIDATDDGPQAASVTVLTHRFWTESLNGDESVVGKQIKLGDRASTIIGVLEPSVPYPTETQLIANVVTSSHHMSATMQDGRVHRMTELFGRLAPGASLEQAVAELRAIHAGMMTAHRESYLVRDDFRINAVRLRDQITSPARTILLVLLAASG
jgi:putative ABC transport system permease protein